MKNQHTGASRCLFSLKAEAETKQEKNASTENVALPLSLLPAPAVVTDVSHQQTLLLLGMRFILLLSVT